MDHEANQKRNTNHVPEEVPADKLGHARQTASQKKPGANSKTAAAAGSEGSSERVSKRADENGSETQRILRPLRTFKDDVARALGKQDAGVVNIAASAEKRRVERRTLSEREQQLQEAIEREGAVIRTLSSKLENIQTVTPPTDRSPESTPLNEPSSNVPQKPYAPPPGVPPRMSQAATPEVNNITEAQQPEQREQTIAKLRAAEKRLAEAQTELANTKRARAAQTPRRFGPAPKPEPDAVHQRIRTLVIAVVSVALIVSAGGISWYVYQNIGTLGSVKPEVTAPTLVPVNQRIAVRSRPEIALPATLRNTLDTVTASDNDLVQLYVTEGSAQQPISAQEFFKLFAPRAPGRLIRTLEDEYTFGMHGSDRRAVFLVVRTTFFENAFAGMLEWEPVMYHAFSPLLGSSSFVPDIGVGDAGRAERRSAFTDQIIQNQDVRVLRDENDNVSLLYSFVNRDTLIIATTIETFVEVYTRILSGRVVR